MASIAELMMQQNHENRIVRLEDNYHSVLKAVRELRSDIKELLKAEASSDKVAEMLEVKIEAIGTKVDKFAVALGTKVDKVSAALGSKVDKVVESMTGRFDDLGNVVGDLGPRILKLEWQVGVILAITGVFLTSMLVPTVINWLKEKVFQTSAVYLAQPTQRSIALAPATIVNCRRRYSAETRFISIGARRNETRRK